MGEAGSRSVLKGTFLLITILIGVSANSSSDPSSISSTDSSSISSIESSSISSTDSSSISSTDSSSISSTDSSSISSTDSSSIASISSTDSSSILSTDSSSTASISSTDSSSISSTDSSSISSTDSSGVSTISSTDYSSISSTDSSSISSADSSSITSTVSSNISSTDPSSASSTNLSSPSTDTSSTPTSTATASTTYHTESTNATTSTQSTSSSFPNSTNTTVSSTSTPSTNTTVPVVPTTTAPKGTSQVELLVRIKIEYASINKSLDDLQKVITDIFNTMTTPSPTTITKEIAMGRFGQSLLQATASQDICIQANADDTDLCNRLSVVLDNIETSVQEFIEASAVTEKLLDDVNMYSNELANVTVEMKNNPNYVFYNVNQTNFNARVQKIQSDVVKAMEEADKRINTLITTSGSEGWKIAVIVLGSVCGVLLVVVLGFGLYILTRKKSKKEMVEVKESAAPVTNEPENRASGEPITFFVDPSMGLTTASKPKDNWAYGDRDDVRQGRGYYKESSSKPKFVGSSGVYLPRLGVSSGGRKDTAQDAPKQQQPNSHRQYTRF